MNLQIASILFVCTATFSACDKHQGAASQPAPAPAAAPSESGKVKTTPPFELTVTPPEPGQVGALLTAAIQLVPKGEYKVNMEYPVRLTVSAPQAAAPRELTLTAKQAAKHTEAQLLFQPGFKVAVAGQHAFVGQLRFSVCTKKQCEIKAEQVRWVAKVGE